MHGHVIDSTVAHVPLSQAYWLAKQTGSTDTEVQCSLAKVCLRCKACAALHAPADLCQCP